MLREDEFARSLKDYEKILPFYYQAFTQVKGAAKQCHIWMIFLAGIAPRPPVESAQSSNQHDIRHIDFKFKIFVN